MNLDDFHVPTVPIFFTVYSVHLIKPCPFNFIITLSTLMKGFNRLCFVTATYLLSIGAASQYRM